MKSLEDIEQEYRVSLAIPASNPSKQIFFCPVGLVGTGKSTITKPISQKLGLLRLSSDEVWKLLKENGYSYDPVKAIGLKIAKEFAHEGCSIAFDMDCGNPEVKQFVEELAGDLRAQIIWVHVTAPEEYIFEKFRKHPPSWLASDSQTMIDNYHAQKAKRAEENTYFDYFFTFDTSRSDLNMQIDECMKKIGNF